MGGGPSTPRVKLPRDRVIVITGANSGIGYEMARELAIMGGQVILACRSEERAKEAINQMRAEYESEKYKNEIPQSESSELQLEFMKLDLTSLQSTMDFIKAFKESGRPLHVLMCNAGVAAPPWGHTADGYEQQFQVNYLGHFLMIAHFLPIMQQSGDDCRIILTSSYAQFLADFDMETIQALDERKYSGFGWYAKSKLYQAMQTITMASKLNGSNITINCFHPGAVKTEISRNTPDTFLYKYMMPLITYWFRSPEEGARTGLYLAVSPNVLGMSGEYYANNSLKTSSGYARNAEYREALWEYTIDCLKEYLPSDFPTWEKGTNAQATLQQ